MKYPGRLLSFLSAILSKQILHLWLIIPRRPSWLKRTTIYQTGASDSKEMTVLAGI